MARRTDGKKEKGRKEKTSIGNNKFTKRIEDRAHGGNKIIRNHIEDKEK